MPENSKSLNEKTFVLEKTDKLLKNEGEPTTVTIAQAGKIENNKRLKAWKQCARIYGLNRQITPIQLKREEVFLTLKGCNLEDWDGQILFKFPLDEDAFHKSWNKLPPLVADELHEKVIQMNPIWSPDKHSSFLRSLSSDQDDDGLRTVICPYCDHYQKVDDSPENEDLEIYNGELEDWEEDGLWFVVTCDLCGQPYKMLSDHMELDDEENDNEDNIDESEDDEQEDHEKDEK